MTYPTLGWYKEQSEHNRHIYEILQSAWPDGAHDWKVTALFYSVLHRANYWLVRETGRAPRRHIERNLRVEGELPQVFGIYNDLYAMSMRARYREGFRTTDYYRGRALALPDQLERRLPFA